MVAEQLSKQQLTQLHNEFVSSLLVAYGITPTASIAATAASPCSSSSKCMDTLSPSTIAKNRLDCSSRSTCSAHPPPKQQQQQRVLVAAVKIPVKKKRSKLVILSSDEEGERDIGEEAHIAVESGNDKGSNDDDNDIFQPLKYCIEAALLSSSRTALGGGGDSGKAPRLAPSTATISSITNPMPPPPPPHSDPPKPAFSPPTSSSRKLKKLAAADVVVLGSSDDDDYDVDKLYANTINNNTNRFSIIAQHDDDNGGGSNSTKTKKAVIAASCTLVDDDVDIVSSIKPQPSTSTSSSSSALAKNSAASANTASNIKASADLALALELFPPDSPAKPQAAASRSPFPYTKTAPIFNNPTQNKRRRRLDMEEPKYQEDDMIASCVRITELEVPVTYVQNFNIILSSQPECQQPLYIDTVESHSEYCKENRSYSNKKNSPSPQLQQQRLQQGNLKNFVLPSFTSNNNNNNASSSFQNEFLYKHQCPPSNHANTFMASIYADRANQVADIDQPSEGEEYPVHIFDDVVNNINSNKLEDGGLDYEEEWEEGDEDVEDDDDGAGFDDEGGGSVALEGFVDVRNNKEKYGSYFNQLAVEPKRRKSTSADASVKRTYRRRGGRGQRGRRRFYKKKS